MSRELPRFLASQPGTSHSRMNSYAVSPHTNHRGPHPPSRKKSGDEQHLRSQSVYVPQTPPRGNGKRPHPPPPRDGDKDMISPAVRQVTPHMHPHHVKHNYPSNVSSRSLSGYSVDADAHSHQRDDTVSSVSGFRARHPSTSASSRNQSQSSTSPSAISRSKSGPQPPSAPRPQLVPTRAVSAAASGDRRRPATAGSHRSTNSSHIGGGHSSSSNRQQPVLSRKMIQRKLDQKRKISSSSNGSPLRARKSDSLESTSSSRSRRTERQATINGNTLMYFVDFLISNNHEHEQQKGGMYRQTSIETVISDDGDDDDGGRKLSRELSKRLPAMSGALPLLLLLACVCVCVGVGCSRFFFMVDNVEHRKSMLHLENVPTRFFSFKWLAFLFFFSSCRLFSGVPALSNVYLYNAFMCKYAPR